MVPLPIREEAERRGVHSGVQNCRVPVLSYEEMEERMVLWSSDVKGTVVEK